MIGWLCATYSFLGGAALLALIGALQAGSRHGRTDAGSPGGKPATPSANRTRGSGSPAAGRRADQVTG
jgi:hypothetical protein